MVYLLGLQQKLNYIHDDLKSSAVMLNPIYPSPNADFGYDVKDYVSISEEMGTMEDFNNLRIAMHKRGIQIIYLDISKNIMLKYDMSWYLVFPYSTNILFN